MRRPHWARVKPATAQPLYRQKDPEAVRDVLNITECYKDLRRLGAKLPRPVRIYGSPSELNALLDQAEAELNRRLPVQ